MAPCKAERAAEIVRPRLPESYRLEASAGGLLAARRDLSPGLARAGFRLGGERRWPDSELRGRGPLGELALEGGSFLVRPFRHGGLLRWLTGARFADPTRPFRELILSAELRAKGIDTPEVVAARAERCAPFGWRLELVTRRLLGVRDGAELLEALRGGELDAGRRRAAVLAVGAAIARLHRHGFVHADLNPRNLLLECEPEDGERPRVWIIDLDRSRFVQQLGEAERRANLRRLLRAVRRREQRGAPFLGRSDYLRFLRGYAEEWRAGGWSWRDDWREILRIAEKRRLWHRLGWRMEGLLGGGPEARDGGARVPRESAGPRGSGPR